ncbi:MAG: AMP-binding protein [Bacteroidales bacterium]
MLFDIDRKSSDSVAAIDDRGGIITYGQILYFYESIAKIIDTREVIFCLCENTIGSLVGYISFYQNKDVVLLLGASIDRELLSELIFIYKPSYLWFPERLINEFNVDVVTRNYGFLLAKTSNKKYPIHEDLSLLLTTSGSTGSPKLVRYKYGNIECNAKAVAEVFNWTADERAICELPMQYSMGLNVINSHLYSGGTVLLVSNSLTSPFFWKFIREQKGTSFTGVPFSYEILNKLRFTQMSLPYLKTIAAGGGKLSDNLFVKLSEYAQINGKRFFATFGTTETSARMSYLPPDLAMSKTGSVGIPIPRSEMFLINELGNRIDESNIEGELCYRGSNVTMGYAFCKEDLAKGDEFNGEYRTGDIARKDLDGFFYILGRKKRFLKLFGLRVSLDQCERLINEKFQTECGCTGDDNRMDIFIENSAITEDVKSFISYKTKLPPSVFNVMFIESLPRNTSKKIIYSLLK